MLHSNYDLYFDKNLRTDKANHCHAIGCMHKFADRGCDARFAICVQRCIQREKEGRSPRPSLNPRAHLSGASHGRCQRQFQESLPIFQPSSSRIGPDVVLCAASSFPFSRCAPNKSAESSRIPRVVTTLRYVTTLGSMAYLTGMRITGNSVWISPRKRAHLTLAPQTDERAAPRRRGIRILDGDT